MHKCSDPRWTTTFASRHESLDDASSDENEIWEAMQSSAEPLPIRAGEWQGDNGESSPTAYTYPSSQPPTRAGTGPTTNIRVYLRAKNLRKGVGLGYQQPDVLARVSFSGGDVGATARGNADDDCSVGTGGTIGERRTEQTEVS